VGGGAEDPATAGLRERLAHEVGPVHVRAVGEDPPDGSAGLPEEDRHGQEAAPEDEPEPEQHAVKAAEHHDRSCSAGAERHLLNLALFTTGETIGTCLASLVRRMGDADEPAEGRNQNVTRVSKPPPYERTRPKESRRAERVETKTALLVYLYSKEEVGLSLALGLLKAYAEASESIRDGWSIRLLHLPVTGELEHWSASIAAVDADLIGFSCYAWNISAVERLIELPTGARRPIIVLGGVEVTAEPARELARRPAADIVVYGEGEATFRELLARLGGRSRSQLRDGLLDLRDIQGIAWRRGRAVRVNSPRPPIEDLTTIPSPYLSGTYGDAVDNLRTAQVETTRGCPYRCTYCFEGRGFKRVRALPLERVRDEIRFLVRRGVKEFQFFDTNINLDRERALALFGFLRTLGPNLRFWFEVRAELMDGELAEALGRLSFFAGIGLQTTHLPALRAIRRTWRPGRFEAGVRTLLNASRFRPCAFGRRLGVAIDIIAGLPHDTVDDVLASFDYAFALAPSRIVVGILKVLPGTELYGDAKRFKYKFDPTDQYVIRSSATMSPADVSLLIDFAKAVYVGYNLLHVVRTLNWFAGELDVRPSVVFVELGRLMARDNVVCEELTSKDLYRFLAEIARQRGKERETQKVGSRLSAEVALNTLQFLREKRYARWREWLFALGYRVLSRWSALAPLPAAWSEASDQPTIDAHPESLPSGG